MTAEEFQDVIDILKFEYQAGRRSRDSEVSDLRHRLEVMTKERERWRSNSGHLRTQLEQLQKQLPDEPMARYGDTL